LKVLVVEDDAETRKGLQQLLEEFDLEVRAASTIAEGLAALTAFDPDVCLTDLQLPDGDGIEFIRVARAGDPRREIVVLTGHGSLGTAVEAMKAGAFDYLVKPLRAAQLQAVLERLRPGTQPGGGDAGLWKTLDETGRFGSMVGVSNAMREMCAVIARIARSDAPVMITGESGSGKEAAAQTIHALSRRSGKPLVAINCGAVSANLIESELFGHERGAFTGADKRRAGYFELAQGGTLFLDEVTEMSLDLQVKFLRVLETRSFRRVGGNEEIASDVRIISSSNRDLLEAVEKKALREDLYYRLNVFPLHVAPLRERREDVPVLARHFLALIAESEEGGRRTFSAAALEKLAAHGWPGNVRELRNAVHRAYVLSDDGLVDETTIAGVLAGRSSGVFAAVRPPVPGPAAPEVKDAEAPASARTAAPSAGPPGDDPLTVPVRVGDSLEDVERRLLERTLAAVGGNKKKAAELLRISLKTVYNKIKQYDLEP
jgi:two-component system, NtrC family, response regulator AtoC